MFHKATAVKFNSGTTLDVSFQDGTVKRFDMAILFDRYPQLDALRDHSFFASGRLISPYGIVWNDSLDIETETIYEEGITIAVSDTPREMAAAQAVLSARAKCGLSQQELSKLSGIDQSDISKIERGCANPSVSTLRRISNALDCDLEIILTPRSISNRQENAL